MHSRAMAAAVLSAALVVPVRSAAAAANDDATLLRVFLTDGTSLVSYGEPARVGDRIIFSMPTAAIPNPPLQLVNLRPNHSSLAIQMSATAPVPSTICSSRTAVKECKTARTAARK